MVDEQKHGEHTGEDLCRAERSNSGGGWRGGIFSARNVQPDVSARAQRVPPGQWRDCALGRARKKRGWAAAIWIDLRSDLYAFGTRRLRRHARPWSHPIG